jgi:hypothetical protein
MHDKATTGVDSDILTLTTVRIFILLNSFHSRVDADVHHFYHAYQTLDTEFYKARLTGICVRVSHSFHETCPGKDTTATALDASSVVDVRQGNHETESFFLLWHSPILLSTSRVHTVGYIPMRFNEENTKKRLC